MDSADLSGVSGTPNFFINGKHHHHGAYDTGPLRRATVGPGVGPDQPSSAASAHLLTNPPAGAERTDLHGQQLKLRPVARAASAGGMMHLRLIRPAHGRYVLLWFTSLPPDPAGTFLETVYGLQLKGRT